MIYDNGFDVLLPFSLYLISGFEDLDSLCLTCVFGDLDLMFLACACLRFLFKMYLVFVNSLISNVFVFCE